MAKSNSLPLFAPSERTTIMNHPDASLPIPARLKRAGHIFTVMFCLTFLPVTLFWIVCSPPYESFNMLFIGFWFLASALPALLFALLSITFRHRRNWHRLIAVSIPLFLFIAWFVLVFPGLEFFCPFYPSIDTEYAPGYTDRGFARIQPGMAETEVIALVGNPLYANRVEDVGEFWHYSTDGKCTFGDFAWLLRAVVFTNGIVKCLNTTTCYD